MSEVINSLILIQQLRLADRKLQMFPMGVSYVTIFGYTLETDGQVKLPRKVYGFPMSTVLSWGQKAPCSNYLCADFM